MKQLGNFQVARTKTHQLAIWISGGRSLEIPEM